IRAGRDAIALKVQRAHPRSDTASVARQVVRLLGKRQAARYFRWELVPLSPQEQAAAIGVGRGFRRPTHRFVYHFDADAAQADACYDRCSALVTTAPLTQRADLLFAQLTEQHFAQ